MTDDLYTTGEARGMTGLSAKTIQRYIKTFPEAFTDRARQTSRGRRYAGRDVKALFVIRELKKQLKTREEIAVILSGDLDNQALPWLEVNNLMQVASEARREIGQIKTYTRKVQDWHDWIKSDSFSIRKRIGEIEAKVNTFDGRLTHVKNLLESILEKIDRDDKQRGRHEKRWSIERFFLRKWNDE